MIEAYTQRGVQDSMETEKGRRLSAAVDPWAYRSRITMPKLIINGANDPYWTLDSLNAYWNDLKGSKFVMYVPNGGHDLGIGKNPANVAQLVSALGGYTRAIASDSPCPNMTWTYKQARNEERLDISIDSTRAMAVLWVAKSDTLDFRESTWEPTPMTNNKTGFTGKTEMAQKGYVAMFGEVTTSVGGQAVPLCTQVTILDSHGAYRPDQMVQ